MNVTLLAHTQINPALAADHPVLRGAGTPQEGIIEYAGRVCYRSDGLMGKNPSFISARVREGHEDIVEHVRFAFRVEGAPLDETILRLVSQPRHAASLAGSRARLPGLRDQRFQTL